MDYHNLNPEKVKKAKEISAGPLGKEMAKFPLQFAKAAFFGDRPAKNKHQNINHGTITLLELQDRPIALTCSHVLDAYRKIHSNPNVIFQIGNLEFNPLERIIDESASSKFDIVTIDLQGLNHKKLFSPEGIGSSFFKPVRWPPSSVQQGEFVAFGGFPGVWRQNISWNEMVFDSWSSGATQVSVVREEYFVCHFEREYWVQSFNLDRHNGLDLHKLGGLSGGPVFIHRNIYWEFIGMIYEFSEGFDLMYIRPANLVLEDGTINKN
jgi:hypothetical protein